MKKPVINPEEVLKDANKVMDMINNLENMDLSNLDAIEEDIKKLEKSLSEKYKHQLEENTEEDLDTEE
jgi:flagellar motility protein MotE (MotC chaperone)